jgi:hypothetical protein
VNEQHLSGLSPGIPTGSKPCAQQDTLARQAIKTPRTSAVAGIIFAVLFTISMVLMRLALSEELGGTNAAAWVQGKATTVTLALTLVPFCRHRLLVVHRHGA